MNVYCRELIEDKDFRFFANGRGEQEIFFGSIYKEIAQKMKKILKIPWKLHVCEFFLNKHFWGHF